MCYDIHKLSKQGKTDGRHGRFSVRVTAMNISRAIRAVGLTTIQKTSILFMVVFYFKSTRSICVIIKVIHVTSSGFGRPIKAFRFGALAQSRSVFLFYHWGYTAPKVKSDGPVTDPPLVLSIK